jgi:hypothetical protein
MILLSEYVNLLLTENVQLTYAGPFTPEQKMMAKNVLIKYIKQTGRESMFSRYNFILTSIFSRWTEEKYNFQYISKGGRDAFVKPYEDAPYLRKAKKFKTVVDAIKDIPTDDNYVYRGMSFEEYVNIKKTGFVKSRGEYNLGDAQKNYTFFGDSFKTARFYAGSFQPMERDVTRNKPGVVIEVPKKLTQPADTIKSGNDPVGQPNEYITDEPISANNIRNVWFLVPTLSYYGDMDINYNTHTKECSQGSRSSPSVQYAVIKGRL